MKPINPNWTPRGSALLTPGILNQETEKKVVSKESETEIEGIGKKTERGKKAGSVANAGRPHGRRQPGKDLTTDPSSGSCLSFMRQVLQASNIATSFGFFAQFR